MDVSIVSYFSQNKVNNVSKSYDETHFELQYILPDMISEKKIYSKIYDQMLVWFKSISSHHDIVLRMHSLTTLCFFQRIGQVY